MDFFLLLVVNFLLIVRPAELIPGLAAIPLYNIFILAGFASVLPGLMQRLQPDRLARADPITTCVLGLPVAIVLSHASHLDFLSARLDAIEFSKNVMYYLVVIGAVSTPARLRSFIYWIAIFIGITSCTALADYYGVVEIGGIRTFMDRVEDWTADRGHIYIPRLMYTGIFSDPNDLSMIAVVGIIIASFGFSDRSLGGAQLLWLALVPAYMATLIYTKSRGGLLALIAGLGAFSAQRIGLKKSLLAGVVLVPAGLVLVGGRQAEIGGAITGGTGKTRSELWSEGLTLMKQAPIFGIGHGQYAEECLQVAHNSFVHCFTELGLFGGSLYLGAFWFALWSMLAAGAKNSLHYQFAPDESLRKLQIPILATVAAWCVSMLSLSRQDVAPTYLMLGLSSSYCSLIQAGGLPPVMTFNLVNLRRIAVTSVAFLLMVHIWVRLTAH